MTSKRDRFLGKTFNYKGGKIFVAENLGVIYEDDRTVYYTCEVVKETNEHEEGAEVEIRYQILRSMLLSHLEKKSPKKSTSRRAA